MQKIIALILVLAGAGGGIALGLQLKSGGGANGHDAAKAGSHTAEGAASHEPAGEPAGGHSGDSHGEAAASGADHGAAATADRDYVKIGRQMIIPVVAGRETRALMLFDLALDVPRSMTELAYSAEPRLRDAFMRELFTMSNTGAFLTTYTDERVVAELRDRLQLAARRVMGDSKIDVLILDIMRQEY